jgi:hypothetical protein
MENNSEQPIKKGRGRPRKYATPEEAAEANRKKTKENYKYSPLKEEEKKKPGPKVFRTIEYINERNREYQRRFREKQLQKKDN